MAAINWQEVITSLGGNVVLLAAAGWLIKLLLSNRFAMEAEKFKIELKTSADTEIERVKALLTRGSRVHEHQVDTLTKLYRSLFAVNGYLQILASSGRLDDASDNEYRGRSAEAINSARDTFLDGRLLMPSDIAEQCDRFFNILFEGQIYLNLAEDPKVIGPHQRADYWVEAQKIATKELPGILHQIETAARNVIHGELHQ